MWQYAASAAAGAGGKVRRMGIKAYAVSYVTYENFTPQILSKTKNNNS